MPEKKHLIGFDLGGTKMLATVMDADYQIVSREKVKTGNTADSEAVYNGMLECIERACKSAGIKTDELTAAGVAVPGPVDFSAGVLLETPNLGFENFPLRDRLSNDLGVSVSLENDVNAGLYGEFVKGAAAGYRHVVGLFPGTGVGGALILNGALYRGARGGAGEIGHMIIQVEGQLCGCGQHGCLEALASKTAIAKDAVGLASSGDAPTVWNRAGTDIKKVKSSVLLESVEKGESAMIDLINRSARFLGIGMANCVNIFNPEAVIIGGGVVEKLGEPYLREAERAMRAHAMSFLSEGVRVAEAQLGDDAVVIGAAALAREPIPA